MELMEKLVKHLSDNVALFDCQGDCPPEEARRMVRPEPEYCNKCFAKQIANLVREVGYMKLADDQSKPKELLNLESKEDWISAYGKMDVLSAWRECYEAMIKAGWRKMEA